MRYYLCDPVLPCSRAFVLCFAQNRYRFPGDLAHLCNSCLFCWVVDKEGCILQAGCVLCAALSSFATFLRLTSGGNTNAKGKGKARRAHPAGAGSGAGDGVGGSASGTTGGRANSRNHRAAEAGAGTRAGSSPSGRGGIAGLGGGKARVKSEPGLMGEGGGALAVPMGTQVRTVGTIWGLVEFFFVIVLDFDAGCDYGKAKVGWRCVVFHHLFKGGRSLECCCVKSVVAVHI